MRLIDADKIRFKDISDGRVPNGIWYCLLDEIKSQPTVQAIPKEWIEKRLQRAVAFTHSKAEGNIIDDGCVVKVVSANFTANVLVNLLEDWEKENEENN